MVDNQEDNTDQDKLLEEIRKKRLDQSEVYEESEEGVVYSPNNPGSEQQMREAKKILEKEKGDEQTK